MTAKSVNPPMIASASSTSSISLVHFTVTADPDTHEWIGQAVPSGRSVDAAEWMAKQDTEAEHYDLFEVPDVDEGGHETGTMTTFAITVVWQR
jgi:hypothetical protein